MSGNAEIKEEYTSSLQDLTFNSKPLISVLTILAEENAAQAKDIVQAIEEHLSRVRTEVKLPVLYLIDCIIKNVGGPYTALFCHNIVSTFCSVFEKVDEKTRSEMFRLRQTWSEVIPQKKLYALDVQIKQLDPAWPLIAPPPPIGIHLNPKFFMPTTTSKDCTVSTTNTTSKAIKNAAPGTDVDPKTLIMQQKIINKQRELLELQQKKVQLELLQTQVKLQEQMKISHTPLPTSQNATNSRNLLLKPEVAKQLAPAPHQHKSGSSKLKGGTQPRNNVPRIAPAQSNLPNSKPIRDPRLLRQMQQEQQHPQATAIPSLINSDANTKPEQLQLTESEINKVVNNKTNVRNERIEHRLVDNNKGNNESQGKTKNLPYSSSLKRSIGRMKSRFSRDKVFPSLLETNNSKNLELIGFAKNNKSDADKLKFKRKASALGEKDSVDKASELIFESPDKNSDKKVDRYPKLGDKQPIKGKSGFKEFKITSKNRAHIRRSRALSQSPESDHDVDLRLPLPSNRIPRIQTNNGKEKNESVDKPQLMDVDLRHLPSIGKKRSSSDNNSSPVKKSKSEIFDVLFGSEDTDLRRQLPVVDTRPPTPPPAPIISEKDANKVLDGKKETNSQKNPSLDVLRAKLANAINQDKLKESELSKSTSQNKSPPSKRPSRDSLNSTQIIISADDEIGIKAGTMTEAQKAVLMSKIVAQMETQQLREAQRRESETSNSGTFQPISDDEFGDVAEENSQKNNNWPALNEEISEMSKFGNVQDDFSTYPRDVDFRDPRRGRVWRGARNNRQNVWDVVPPPARVGMRQVRPLPDPWLRPLIPPPVTMNVFPPPPPPPPSIDIPPLIYAHPNSYKYITIDNEPRDIRYYDETTIAFLNNGDPREVSFRDGARRIFFDNEPILLYFNQPYKEIFIKGNLHRVKLGAPSREIFIDGNGYECYFDMKEKLIELDGNCVTVKMDPPPPQVKIGDRRLDLVVGKTQLVVDAKQMFTVFLDAKLQTFNIDDVEHTLKFVDSLKAVLIDDVKHIFEFGGLPKSIVLKGKKYFIRFSTLPKGIRAGFVKIQNMDVTDEYGSPIREIGEAAPEPLMNKRVFKPESPDVTNSPSQFESHYQNLDNLDMLSSVMASSMIPSQKDGTSYSIEHTTPSESQEFLHSQSATQPETENKSNSMPPVLNINDLFQRLVATGIVATASEPATEPAPKPFEEVKPRDSRPQEFRPFEPRVQAYKPPMFNKPNTLKVRQPAVIDMLYVGQQCSSCGVRFDQKFDNYYKQHLDWHFRQNRKGRKTNRLSSFRRWYYSFSDWKNYEELENLDERGKSFFENQAGSAKNEVEEEEIEIPCIAADPDVTDPFCEVCLEKIEQFYNEEKEEWQLRMAMRVDDKIYHPLCYDDYQTSLIDTETQEIPGLDGVEEAPSPEPNDIDDVMEVIDNIDDEVEPASAISTVKDEHAYKILEENNLIDDDSDEADDDVIINEVIPERIVVDDDKEDDYVMPAATEYPIIPAIVIKEEPIDDGFVDIEDGVVKAQTTSVKIKTEPVDKDETSKAENTLKTSDARHIEVISSMDGNFELNSLNSDASLAPLTNSVAGKIKINITKPIPTVIAKEIPELINDSVNPNYVDPNEPLPPGEEPVQLNIKPTLQGVQLKRNPPVKKGSELTGLCSIM